MIAIWVRLSAIALAAGMFVSFGVLWWGGRTTVDAHRPLDRTNDPLTFTEEDMP